eukprot:Awhi_evm1s8804
MTSEKTRSKLFSLKEKKKVKDSKIRDCCNSIEKNKNDTSPKTNSNAKASLKANRNFDNNNVNDNSCYIEHPTLTCTTSSEEETQSDQNGIRDVFASSPSSATINPNYEQDKHFECESSSHTNPNCNNSTNNESEKNRMKTNTGKISESRNNVEKKDKFSNLQTIGQDNSEIGSKATLRPANSFFKVYSFANGKKSISFWRPNLLANE